MGGKKKYIEMLVLSPSHSIARNHVPVHMVDIVSELHFQKISVTLLKPIVNIIDVDLVVS